MTQAPELIAKRAPMRPLGQARLPVPAWLSKQRVMTTLVGLVALAMNLFRLGDPVVWGDEAFSVELARQPLGTIWLAITNGEPHMALYDLLLYLWLRALNLSGLPQNGFAVRLPSALFAAGAAVMLYILGRRFIGSTGGLVAVALYVCNSFQLTAAQNARSYALQLLLVILAWYALLEALAGPTSQRRRWWIAFVAASALACYAQTFSLFSLAAQGVAFVALATIGEGAQRFRAQWRTTTRAFAGVGALVTPMLFWSREGSNTGWLPQPDLQAILAVLKAYLLGSSRLSVYAWFGLTALAIAVFVGLLLMERWTPRLAWMTRVSRHYAVRMDDGKPLDVSALWLIFASWFVIPLAGSWLLSQRANSIFSTRYLIIILPAMALAIGLGVTLLRYLPAQALAAAAFLIPALTFAIGYYPAAQVEDTRTLARFIEAQYQPGDGLVCYDNTTGCQPAIQYYLHTDKSPADFSADAPGAWLWSAYATEHPAAHATDALNPRLLAAYGARYHRLIFIAARVPADEKATLVAPAVHWLNQHYRLVAAQDADIGTVYIYETGA